MSEELSKDVAVSKSTSIYAHMVRGSAWALVTRWAVRAIGLVSTVVLARLLTPEDFGVAAMGALAMGFVQGFSELGAQQLLIRESDATRDDSDTAWTIQILQGAFVGSLLLLGAPFAASYFGDERALAVIRVVALSAMLGGATNIGLVLARKNLNFAIDFKFRTIVRILSFLITMALALWLRSYWALVLASVASTALSVPLSFLMHAYRPRLSLVSIGKYLRFASSIVPMGVGRYLNSKADVMVVGGLAGTSVLGSYHVASEFAGMLTNEILMPAGRGLMPSYAKLNHDSVRYADAFRYVLAGSATLIFPVGFGLWVVAPHMVNLVLGQQWTAAIPLVRILALYYMIAGLIHTMSNQVLIAGGHERRTAVLIWARLALLVPAVIVAGRFWGVEGVAGGAVVAAIISMPLVVFVLTKSIALTSRDVVAAVWRPLLAALVMAAGVTAISSVSPTGNVVSLIVEVASGVVLYFLVLWILWSSCGRPPGLERAAVEFVSRTLSRASHEA